MRPSHALRATWRTPCAALLLCAAVGPLAACSQQQIEAVLDATAITTTGGRANSQSGTGGTSGMLYARVHFGGSGTIEARSSGALAASFTPTGFPVDLGPQPLVVAADLAIPVVAVEPATGTAYAVSGDTSLYVSDGNGTLADEPAVSGLDIQSGATLTLPITSGALPGADLDFSHDVVNFGVLTVVDVGPAQRASIDLHAGGTYHGSGRIETHGTAVGQSGGDIVLRFEGAIFNDGAFTTFGAASAAGDGGDGGEIVVRTDWVTQGEKIENTGRMDSRGGDATGGSGVGGDAGPISVLAYLSLWNEGDLVASGGDGSSGGGDGARVHIAGYYRGDLLALGDVTTDGGDAVTGVGGTGGAIDLQAWGGASSGSGGIGGTGGDVLAYVSSSDDNWEPVPLDVPAGDLFVSGAVDTTGGAAMGANGLAGAGGDAGFEIENDVTQGGQSIHLLGFTVLDGSGGNGYVGGSSSGAAFELASTAGVPTGPIVHEAPVDVSGGDAGPALAGSMGGDGGGADLAGGSFSYATITTAGGTGATPGANGTITTSP